MWASPKISQDIKSSYLFINYVSISIGRHGRAWRCEWLDAHKRTKLVRRGGHLCRQEEVKH